MRAEFALKADQVIMTEQRLKGSCPFLFAYNGKANGVCEGFGSMGLGDRAAHQLSSGSARIEATEEWYKIGRNELVPTEWITTICALPAELWETYYYDYLALMTVDHPAGTEIFTRRAFRRSSGEAGDHCCRHASADCPRYR